MLATVEIHHKCKDVHNKICHAVTYNGSCEMLAKYSVREMMGGVESNSAIHIRIHTTEPIVVACGDRVVLNGTDMHTVQKWSACQTGVSPKFAHVALCLR